MMGRAIFAMFAAIALAGCFASEEPLIEAGEAVLPIDHGITICLEDDQPCIELLVDGDGYRTGDETPSGEVGRARFAPLVQRAGKQIFILEVQSEPGTGYIHLVARRSADVSQSGSGLELAAPDCSELDREARDDFEAAGGVVSVGMMSTCFAPNLKVLRTVWLDSIGPSLGDDDWWASMAD